MKEEEKKSSTATDGESEDESSAFIDYKNVVLMKKFVTIGGRMLSRRVTNLSSKEQRRAVGEVKKLRFLGLLPYCDRHK